MRMPFALALALIATTPAIAQPAPPPSPPLPLHPVFQDHTVLQRDRPISLWGVAQAGAKVTVSLAGKTATVTAGPDSIWRTSLPAMPAGGPYELSAATGSVTQTLKDVMVGDVWLCSGQSNMEWPVIASINGPGEASAANDPLVRLLTVPKATGVTPRTAFGEAVSWQPVTPDSIKDFSAVCWFMARELRKTEKVPLGLIDSSWGGTAINAWRSEASMAGEAAVADQLKLLALFRTDAAKGSALWGKTWGDWWRTQSTDPAGREPWQADAAGDWKPVPALTYWEQWGVPELAQYSGLVWYRTEIELTAAQAKKGATLNLGVVDDLDVTYVNGTGVGATSSWDAIRSYRLAPGVLRKGRNVITVSAFDSWGPGGMAGAAEQRVLRFDDGTSIPLPDASGWRYRIASGVQGVPHAPWESAAGLGSIYNGMIAPLGAYGLRGAAWYQGESDAGTPGYAEKLQSLMAAWRSQFGDAKLPFVIVQLPQWGARVPKPAESGFAGIREEQRKAVARDPNAALVVTIDIGDWEDLHPVNKQDVGTRAAIAARFLTYGGKDRPSGPFATTATRQGNSVVVRFQDYNGDLLSYSGAPLGFELCGTAMGSCRFVPARLDGQSVFLDIGTGPADRVRYCWGESPICNLYDGSGLPAGPFERAVDP